MLQEKLGPRAVCLLTIVRLLGPLTLSKPEVVMVDAGVAVVVVVDVVEEEGTPLVVDVVKVGRAPLADVVILVEVGAVVVGGLTDVSVSFIILLVKLAVAVTLFVDADATSVVVVVVDLVGVVVVVVCRANSEQWH